MKTKLQILFQEQDVIMFKKLGKILKTKFTEYSNEHKLIGSRIA